MYIIVFNGNVSMQVVSSSWRVDIAIGTSQIASLLQPRVSLYLKTLKLPGGIRNSGLNKSNHEKRERLISAGILS
jgi:hypothetical protein